MGTEKSCKKPLFSVPIGFQQLFFGCFFRIGFFAFASFGFFFGFSLFTFFFFLILRNRSIGRNGGVAAAWCAAVDFRIFFFFVVPQVVEVFFSEVIDFFAFFYICESSAQSSTGNGDAGNGF